jgi:hypothetical protein
VRPGALLGWGLPARGAASAAAGPWAAGQLRRAACCLPGRPAGAPANHPLPANRRAAGDDDEEEEGSGGEGGGEEEAHVARAKARRGVVLSDDEDE